MTTRPPVSFVDGTPALKLIAGLFLAVAMLVGAWFAIADGLGRASITVNDHTDNAVPLVDRQAPRLRIGA